MTLTCEYAVDETTGEPRRLPRMEVAKAVRLFEPFSGEYLPAVTCNVSGEGVCLLVSGGSDLRPGRFVTLHGNPTVGPRLSGGTDRATTARVVWAKPDPTDVTLTRVGLQLYARPAAVAA